MLAWDKFIDITAQMSHHFEKLRYVIIWICWNIIADIPLGDLLAVDKDTSLEDLKNISKNKSIPLEDTIQNIGVDKWLDLEVSSYRKQSKLIYDNMYHSYWFIDMVGFKTTSKEFT